MHPIMRFNKWAGPMCNPSKITKKGKFVDMILDKNNNFNQIMAIIDLMVLKFDDFFSRIFYLTVNII